MIEAKMGDTVKVHYTGKLTDGTVFDSSQGQEPLEFEIGGRRLLQPFETGVIGMSVGESRTVTINPDEGYGQRRDDLVMEIDKANLPDKMAIEQGQRLQMNHPDGNTFVVTVAAVGDTTVQLDANHPLAGQVLEFDIELIKIG